MGIVERASATVIRASATARELWRARPRTLRPIQPQPASTQSWFYSGWADADAVWVTPEQMLGLPAANRCVTLIANAVATMSPLKVYESDERTEVFEPYPIVRRPSALFPVFDWFFMATAHLVSTGNLVALYGDHDPRDGYPRQLVVVPTSQVNGRFVDGYPVYEIGGQRYGPDEVLHVRAFSVPGQLMGIGPVEVHRRTMAGALNQATYAANTYRTGGVPAGVVTMPVADPTSEQTEAVQERWIDRFGNGQRKPVVFGEGWTFTPIAWSPEDAQFLQAQQFTAAQMAWIFGLLPSDLEATAGAAGSLTYANLSQRQSARIVESYGPWLRRIEEAFTDAIPGGRVALFQRARYVAASRRDLIDELANAKAAGFLTVDEARAELGREPLPEDEEPEPPLEVESEVVEQPALTAGAEPEAAA